MVIRPTCDRVYVGGFFSSIGGQVRGRVATLDPTTGLALPWDPGANGPVFALVPARGVVYIAGVFNAVGLVTRNRVAAVDPQTGVAKAWDANSNGSVRSLVTD